MPQADPRLSLRPSLRPVLRIFAKLPRQGTSKTRLARDIGPAHAQRHYRAMTARVLRGVRDPRWDVEVWATPDAAVGREPLWRGRRQVPQGPGSLSDRLARAFADPRPTCVVGTDSPQVTARDVGSAFRALRGADMVLGPATDGGFWLIAARGPLSGSTFEGVRWSHPDTLADMAANMAANMPGRVAYLQTLTDVDDLTSLRQAAREAKGGRARRPF